jgi:hypothetical protein
MFSGRADGSGTAVSFEAGLRKGPLICVQLATPPFSDDQSRLP